MMGRNWFLVAALSGLLVASGCARHKHRAPDLAATQEPDKVLYERAMEDIQNSKYDVARLTLQTLINTYPDSEYLAKAKLAIADSYYKEGGTAGLAQAEAEYKDFITFFPTAPESAEAQMKIAMAHYRQMEKPDRDRTHTKRAEEEFRALLQNYPDSPYAAEAEQRLREVQEVLAEGDFRVSRFYYIKESNRAAYARLKDVVNRYPNYSQADRALLMLGDTIQRMFRGERKAEAAEYYKRIITDYPLSASIEAAKNRLRDLGETIPQPKPEALARAQIEKEQQEKLGLMGRVKGIIHRAPDVSGAKGKVGKPTMTPPERPSAETPPPAAEGESSSSMGIVVQTVPQASGGVSASGTTTGPTPAPSTPNASPDSSSSAPAASGQPAAGSTPAALAGASNTQPGSANKPSEKDNKKVKESSSRKRSIFRRIIPFGGKDKRKE